MASDLDSMLLSIQQGDYVTLATMTLVGYDYVLTFTKEIEYIWTKRWSKVSSLFVLARYFGLYTFVINSLSHLINLLDRWLYIPWLGAVDLVMILRVWAMYSQSRLILGTLLTLYILEIIPIIITCAIYSTPSKSIVTIVQVLGDSFCVAEPASPTWTTMDAIFQLTLASVMYMLVIFQFIKQSFQMYKGTKKWQLNQYITMIFREGLLYFIFVLIFNILNCLFALGKLPTSGWQFYVLYILEGVPQYILIPRFIINMRELYEHESQGRHGGDIDSKFGLASLSARGAVGTMVFAEDGQNEESEQVEEIQLVERGNQGVSGA